MDTNPSPPPRFALHGWLGLLLIATAWPLSWGLDGLRTHVLFFPLWLGYILTVDALVLRRSGTSLLSRSPRGFVALFALSIPVWWFFELLNLRLRNWAYLGESEIGLFAWITLSSLSYSTVIPAVFETAELVATFRWTDRFAHGPRLKLSPGPVMAAVGALMIALMLAWPELFFPFVWLGLIFLLEPLAVRLGRRSLSADLAHGDWRPVVALATGVLICGFFWELWNFYSFPKWVYRIPYFDFARLFEMPALGYLGYLPFALELYLLAQLLLPRGPQLRLGSR